MRKFILILYSHIHGNEAVKKIAMKKLKENLKVLEDKEFKARITEEKDVTFDLFKDLCNLAFKEQRSDSRIQNVNIFWIKTTLQFSFIVFS